MELEPCLDGTNDTEVQVTPHAADVCVIPQNGNELGEPTDTFPVEPGNEVSRKDLCQPNMAKPLMKSESGFQNMEICSKNYRLEKAAVCQHQCRSSDASDKVDTMDPGEIFNRDLLRQKKQLHSSDRSHSSTSTCSSVYSSQESDEVFSDDEDRSRNRRKLLRKTKSWKTFFTVIHWSLQRQNSWVQLAGHEGNFKPSEHGQILKKFSHVENACLQALMEDALRPYVPTYYGVVEKETDKYIQMEDLLKGLESPSIMDCKMGVSFCAYEPLSLATPLPKCPGFIVNLLRDM
ncbi:inositol-trisphosphate 3-kinase A-like [Lissotriton helveticus]